jgi:gamma-glutamyltranspeptidase / glutathione hydrolase
MLPMIRFLLTMSLCFAPALAAAKGTVSSADPRATDAGMEILRAGGSATDASMAMMLVLTVVEPQSSGIGGGGFLVHHDAKTKMVATVDGRETAPSSATPKLFLNPDGTPMRFREAVPGGRSVGVPGNIALMAKAHKKWGKLKWAKLFDPAIRIAENGYEVTPRLAGVIKTMSAVWGDFPETRAIYWQDGRPKAAGETIRNPALAKLLRDVAKRGPKAFYSGQNAQAIVDAAGQSKRNPTVITKADIAKYQAKDRAAVCTTYRAYKLCGMGPPSSGATTVFQILGMVERFDMKALGKDDPKSWHLIAEAMQLAYADREKYLGDADFVSVPVAGLLDKAYIASRSATISETKALGAYAAGNPPGAPQRISAVSGEVSGTTHFVAVDGAGSVATYTSTVEGPFGSQLVANGYILNNELTDFTWVPEKQGALVANRVQPGKRPLSSMSPTIVYNDKGEPIFTVGAAGGKTIIMQVAKTLIAHLDWGLPVDQAVAAPNIYFGGDGLLLEANTPLAAMAGPLAGFGRTVVQWNGSGKLNAAAKVGDKWVGAADPRSEGTAATE